MLSKGVPNETNLSLTVLKALDILECVANADSSLLASEVAILCEISRPTAYRLLSTLLARGYVVQDNDSGYRLGTQALTLSQKMLASLDLPELAKPLMRQLSDISNETVHLAVLDNAKILYIDKVESTQSVRLTATIGTRNELYCSAMGKAIMAFLPTSEQSQLLEQLEPISYTAATITDKTALIEELTNVRKQKYAIDNEENEEGVRCVGAPIFDRTGRVFAAMSISGPAYRFSLSRLHALSSLVIDSANAISSHLGYAP